MAMLQLGKDADKELMATSLMTAFNDFKVALPLDSVKQTNKDGSFKLDKKTGLPKIKTEYSKDIAGILVGHHVDFNRVGSDLYNLKKYKEAYDAWGAVQPGGCGRLYNVAYRILSRYRRLAG